MNYAIAGDRPSWLKLTTNLKDSLKAYTKTKNPRTIVVKRVRKAFNACVTVFLSEISRAQIKIDVIVVCYLRTKQWTIFFSL